MPAIDPAALAAARARAAAGSPPPTTTTTTTTTTSPAAPAAGGDVDKPTRFERFIELDRVAKLTAIVVAVILIGLVLWGAVEIIFWVGHETNTGHGWAILGGIALVVGGSLLIAGSIYRALNSRKYVRDLPADASKEDKATAREEGRKARKGTITAAIFGLVFMVGGISILMANSSPRITGDTAQLQTYKQEGGAAYNRIKFLSDPKHAKSPQSDVAKTYVQQDKAVYDQLEILKTSQLDKANQLASQLVHDRKIVEDLGKAKGGA